MQYFFKRFWLIVFALFLIVGCGGGGSSATPDKPDTPEEKPSSYKGLQFYYQPLSSSKYKLAQLSDSDFNALSEDKKLKVANKLLVTFFFGFNLETLQNKIAQNNFISSIKAHFSELTTNKGWLEDYILNDDIFKQYSNPWYRPQELTILTRFYAMNNLDSYYLHNWIAYVLTQTIMFSPAYELSSTHTSNIANVYNRLVNMLEINSGMRYITYVHMSSEDNWRRFRSPEDNGREMLEIYLLDTNDSHVPLAGKALQNWKLNTDSDTLEVGLNKNTTPLSLFGTTVYSGDDFYRELVKCDDFTYGVTKRLVDFFFPLKSETQKDTIAKTIVSSKPETWQDILLQIVFSKEYLLNTTRPISAEELFFSLTKKTNYRVGRTTIRLFRDVMVNMHQATMKYKLGKLDRVPLDTLSFANYHKYIRERVMIRHANPEQNNADSWNYYGWQSSFIDIDNFEFIENNQMQSLENFINYLFKATIARSATTAEMLLFKSHMSNNSTTLKHEFNLCYRHNDAQEKQTRRYRARREIAIIVLDYISRLAQLYQISKEN